MGESAFVLEIYEFKRALRRFVITQGKIKKKFKEWVSQYNNSASTIIKEAQGLYNIKRKIISFKFKCYSSHVIWHFQCARRC